MITKVYFLLWALLFFAAAAIFLTGNMTALTLMVFGFVSFGMVFMGMMGVLPILVTHPPPLRSDKPEKVPRTSSIKATAARMGEAATGLFDPKGVNYGKPKYP